MHIPVLIERLGTERCRAKTGEPFGLVAEARTPNEALNKLRDLIGEKLRSGIDFVALDIPAQASPLHTWAGSLDPQDPMVQEWIQIMEENRRKADEDPDVL